MNKSEREELVQSINRGAYESKNVVTIGQCWFFFFLLLAFPILLIIENRLHGGINLDGAIATFSLPLIMLLIIVLRYKQAKRERTDMVRIQKLILEGEMVEAEIDTIDETPTRYQIVCKGQYDGKEYTFESKTFDDKPLSLEKRSITVFVEKGNPANYFVNYYERIPKKAGGQLQERSEIKQDQNVSVFNKRKALSNSISTILITIFVIIVMAAIAVLFLINNVLVVFYMLGIVVVFLVISVVLSFCKIKGELFVLRHGYYVMAKGEKYWLTNDDDSVFYNFSAIYIEPRTGSAYQFVISSGSNKARSLENLVGTDVKVYINPDNMKQYFIDTNGALEMLGFAADRL